jgi:large subunit ribosomal protein L31e
MMAEKKDSKVILERTYIVPLRKEWLKVQRYRRAKKAVTALRLFLEKHMKTTDVKIGQYANLKVWERGIKNPPHHIQVIAKKYENGIVHAEIIDAPVTEITEKEAKKKTKEKKKATETKKEDKPEKTETKKEDKTEKTETKKEDKTEKTETKKEDKTEKTETKKEDKQEKTEKEKPIKK